jgi:hypothetical protein
LPPCCHRGVVPGESRDCHVILFPPSLIVFLVGLAFIYFGVADKFASSGSENSISKQEIENEKSNRQNLGYDE